MSVCVRHVVELDFSWSLCEAELHLDFNPCSCLIQKFCCNLWPSHVRNLDESDLSITDFLMCYCVHFGHCGHALLGIWQSEYVEKKGRKLDAGLTGRDILLEACLEKKLITLQLRFNFPKDSSINTGLNSGCMSIHTRKWLNCSLERCNCM